MKTKNSNPANLLAGKSVQPIIVLYFQINHLKQLYRQGWLRKGRDIREEFCESVADHSFGMTLLAIFICELYFPYLDVLKVVMMCLLHELGEIKNGDPCSPTNHKDKLEKYHNEQRAITELLRDIPDQDKYLALWEEFENGDSAEAHLVRQLDKLEMAFQSKIYALQHGKNLQEFIDDVRTHLKSKNLLKILAELETI